MTEPDPPLAEAEALAREEAARAGRSYVIDMDTGHVRVLLAELDRVRRDRVDRRGGAATY